MTEEILSAVDGQLFAVWFLIGAALVFWMQAGFAMVETGFTRAKNAGNILMKNLMDFCIGTVVFILIGFGLLLGEDVVGLIGKPGLDIFTAYENFDYSNFVFNLVFCATTATIVSGAMAERTKFLSYCIYSGVISALIYPIEAHWIWGGGWLSQLGFHDFAGSCAIHMVGGISALIGAKLLGPRIGKFDKDKSGKIVKVNAFPGHNLPIGCLGVFILWLGWYGFNGAACTSVEQLGSVFLTTTVAPAIATVVCMVFTWIKYGKPDVSMCLNASLAGLVAITAPCDVTDCFGAIVIGAVAGLLVVFGVWLLDYKLHIDVKFIHYSRLDAQSFEDAASDCMLLNRWLNPVPPQIIYSFRFVLRVSLKLFLTEIFFSRIYLRLSANQPKVESHIIAKLSLVFAQEAVLSPHSAPAALRIHGKRTCDAAEHSFRSKAQTRLSITVSVRIRLFIRNNC